MSFSDRNGSYPPGCSGPPDDRCPPCDVCGRDPDSDCICPECDVCGVVGNPTCYKPADEGGHGMELSDAQITAHQVMELEREVEALQSEVAGLIEELQYLRNQHEHDSFGATTISFSKKCDESWARPLFPRTKEPK